MRHWRSAVGRRTATLAAKELSKKTLRKITMIFLPISLNMCFGCSKEPSHRDGSFEYPQHMFWLRNKKNKFQLHTLIWEPAGLFFFISGLAPSVLELWIVMKKTLTVKHFDNL